MVGLIPHLSRTLFGRTDAVPRHPRHRSPHCLLPEARCVQPYEQSAVFSPIPEATPRWGQGHQP